MAASGNTSSMQDTGKSVLKTAGAAFALCVIAYASGSHESNADVKARTNPPEMKLVGSADEQIRTTGTQGVAENASQGTVETAEALRFGPSSPLLSGQRQPHLEARTGGQIAGRQRSAVSAYQPGGDRQSQPGSSGQ